MTSLNPSHLNKIGFGYSDKAGARVSRGVVAALAGEISADRRVLVVGGRIEGGLCDLAAATLAANRVGILSTDFCGFQRVGVSGVCLVLSVCFRERRANALFAKACPLIGNLLRLCLSGFAGGVASRFQRPDRQGGATPSARPALSVCPSRSTRWQIWQKVRLGPKMRSISRSTLCWFGAGIAKVREVHWDRMGSGVRAVCESVLNGRLAHRPIGTGQFLQLGVGVQARFSSRFELNGIGKLCPVGCHVK